MRGRRTSRMPQVFKRTFSAGSIGTGSRDHPRLTLSCLHCGRPTSALLVDGHRKCRACALIDVPLLIICGRDALARGPSPPHSLLRRLGPVLAVGFQPLVEERSLVRESVVEAHLPVTRCLGELGGRSPAYLCVQNSSIERNHTTSSSGLGNPIPSPDSDEASDTGNPELGRQVEPEAPGLVSNQERQTDGRSC